MNDLAQLALIFASLSLLAVGGGHSAVPEMQRQAALHGWVNAGEFCRLYNLGQLAPGPNTLLVTVAVGQRVGGLTGALVVSAAFVLPAGLLAFGVGRVWSRLAGSPWRKALQEALAPITIGLMITGVFIIARNSVGDLPTAAIALAATGLLLWRKLNPTMLILAGGLIGLLLA